MELQVSPLTKMGRKDMWILSKLWGDASDTEYVEDSPSPIEVAPNDDGYTQLVSKSHKKGLKKQKVTKDHW